MVNYTLVRMQYALLIIIFNNTFWVVLNGYCYFCCRSPDGHYLALSSQDGYCTLLEFEHDELGSSVSLSGLLFFFHLVLLFTLFSSFAYNCFVPSLNLLLQSALEYKKVKDEKKNPVQKPEDTSIDLTTNDSVVAVDSTKPKAGNNEGKQESPNKNPVQKPEDMVIDETTNDSVVTVDSTKPEEGNNEGKQVPPSSASTPISTKPAKRRITPIAIDP